MREIRSAVLILFIPLIPVICWAQTQLPDDSIPEYAQQPSATPSDPAPTQLPDKPVPAPSQAKDDQNKKEDSEGRQTKRMLWVVPNFAAVNANTQLPPLSTREKFKLAAEDSVTDYSSYTWAGILAGQAMLLKSDPELGTGIKGYGRYYWRTFVDGISGTFFTEAIVPSIMHEDPRYYTLEHGSFVHRLGYSISRMSSALLRLGRFGSSGGFSPS